MKNKETNWWTDPKNKEEVERLSWWNHVENKTHFNIPISIIQSEGCYIATCNEDTKKFLGSLTACAQGMTKEEAIQKMFNMINMMHQHTRDCEMNYIRYVPFMKGDWKHIGGRWFTVFGYNFHFRYGNGMKGGKYVPFTKLNISITSLWKSYKRYKNNQNED